MRPKILTGICILAAVAGVYLLNRGVRPTSPETGSKLEVEKMKASGTERKPSPESSSKRETGDISRGSDAVLSANERKKALLPTMEELKPMFDTPVEFYGQVLDQFENPVVKAKITCSWPYMGPMDSPVKLQSTAPNGQFEIVGIKAIAITVIVDPPPGYAQIPESTREVPIAKIPDRILHNDDYKKLTPQQKEMMARVHGTAEGYKADKTKPMIFRLTKL